MELEIHILARLVVALVLGAALGFERESAGKPAGLRTHMLVAMGAALFVGLGELLVARFEGYGQQSRFDPTRMLEAVVAGVSFLGAGTIFFARRADRVHGLTTAAALWTTAGVGLAVGVGSFVLAVGATVLQLLVLRALLSFESRRKPAAAPPPSEPE